MSLQQTLNNLFPTCITNPSVREDLPSGAYMVYILAHCGQAIVVGHGKRNRASVIFDSLDHITQGHIKALFVRLYNLFGQSKSFDRFIIVCNDKSEAMLIEHKLHQEIGGNKCELSHDILRRLFRGLAPSSIEYMVLQMALCSSFDGISDLRKWRRKGILNDRVWDTIKKRLQLPTKQ